jgi:large subunit ribosomal protein L10
MAKTKERKKEIIDQLTQDLKDNEMVVIADYQGLSNLELQGLRDRLKKDQVKVQVVKNTLFQVALGKSGLKIDEKLFCRPLLISTSQDISPAKVFEQTSKEVDNLEVLGGIYQGEYQDQSFIEKLAQIPSREELLIQLIGQLKAPYYGLANVLRGNIVKLIYILKEKSKVKE